MNPLKTGFIHLGADKITCSIAVPLSLSSQQAVPMSGHKINFQVMGGNSLVWICTPRGALGIHSGIQHERPNFQKVEMLSIFSNLSCLNLLDVKKKKTPIITVHTQNTLAYFFNCWHFLGGGQSQIPGVQHLTAWQAV